MNKAKRFLSCSVKFLLLVIPVACMILFLNQFTVNKEDVWHVPKIENAPDGSYDVIILGSSHMMYTLQPAQLYGEYGIVSCNLSTPAQPISSSYYLIKEMIERHHPSLVVLDLFTVNSIDAYADPVRLHQAWDFFPLSKNKHDMIQNLVHENKEEFYFPVILYHGRWKELIREDYMYRTSAFNETFLFLDGNCPFPEPFTPLPESEMQPLPQRPEEYLRKIITLCQETGTQLLLTVMPFRADVSELGFQQQRGFHTAGRIAQEMGADYLNTLFYLEEMNFDFMTDMVEDSHVNPSGGKKATAFLGKYIKEHYSVPDRSQDPAYSHWQDNYAQYLDELAARQIY